jgi:hypothetical protein
MTTAISDRALDLGVFALDDELESGADYSNTVYHAPLQRSVSISTRRISSKRMNASKPPAKPGLEPSTTST